MIFRSSLCGGRTGSVTRGDEDDVSLRSIGGKKQGAFSLRVNTHPDNLAMQKAIAKAGFTKCGVIRLTEGAEKGAVRFSYERFI